MHYFSSSFIDLIDCLFNHVHHLVCCDLIKYCGGSKIVHLMGLPLRDESKHITVPCK